MKKVLLITGFNLVFFLLAAVHPVFAKSTVMRITPAEGSFDKTFVESLTIEGNGDKFNAAEATVTLSPNLVVDEIEPGDCNFSFIKTPTTSDPSFSGVLLSKASSSCTVYKLTLVPVDYGEASVKISHGSVKRFGDAAEVLNASMYGLFTLTGIDTPTHKNTASASATTGELYVLNLKFNDLANKPITNSNVLLTNPDKTVSLDKSTDSKGVAEFADLKSGVYAADLSKDGVQLSEQIINVVGKQHTIAFSYKVDANISLLKRLQVIDKKILFAAGIGFIALFFSIFYSLKKLLHNSKKSSN